MHIPAKWALFFFIFMEFLLKKRHKFFLPQKRYFIGFILEIIHTAFLEVISNLWDSNENIIRVGYPSLHSIFYVLEIVFQLFLFCPLFQLSYSCTYPDKSRNAPVALVCNNIIQKNQPR